MSVYKDEHKIISKLIIPELKRRKFFVKRSIKINQRIKKLVSEDVLSKDELDMKHPGQPDIDLVFWNSNFRSSDPTIYAAEVKYFRNRKGKINYSFYAGLDEALALLTFGFDFICLWHFFDEGVETSPTSFLDNKNGSIMTYSGLVQEIVDKLKIPITYYYWMIAGPKSGGTNQLGDLIRAIALTSNKRNPFRTLPIIEARRNIIRKALRIV